MSNCRIGCLCEALVTSCTERGNEWEEECEEGSQGDNEDRVHTRRQGLRPAQGCRLARTARDRLGDLRVPDMVEIGGLVAVRHVNVVAANVEVFAVQRLADVADELEQPPFSTLGAGE